MLNNSELTHLKIYEDPLKTIENNFRKFIDMCFLQERPKNFLSEFASIVNLDVETFNIKKEEDLSQKYFYNFVTNNIGKTSRIQVFFKKI